RGLVADVWVPQSVERREPGGRQRFVDRNPVLDPRVAARCGRSMRGQARREAVIEQAGIRRAAAVMDQPDDRAHAEVPKPLEAAVRPRPVTLVGSVRRGPFPKNGEAQRRKAERREPVEVVRARAVATEFSLVAVAAVKPVQGALRTTPDLEFLHNQPCGGARASEQGEPGAGKAVPPAAGFVLGRRSLISKMSRNSRRLTKVKPTEPVELRDGWVYSTSEIQLLARGDLR